MLERFDTGGGHLVLAFVVFLIGCALVVHGIPFGEKIADSALGALFMGMVKK